MKTNLANFPKRPLTIAELPYYVGNIHLWKEAFEKELRKKLAKYADERHTSPHNSAVLLLGMESMIREVLGE